MNHMSSLRVSFGCCFFRYCMNKKCNERPQYGQKTFWTRFCVTYAMGSVRIKVRVGLPLRVQARSSMRRSDPDSDLISGWSLKWTLPKEAVLPVFQKRVYNYWCDLRWERMRTRMLFDDKAVEMRTCTPKNTYNSTREQSLSNAIPRSEVKRFPCVQLGNVELVVAL